MSRLTPINRLPYSRTVEVRRICAEAKMKRIRKRSFERINQSVYNKKSTVRSYHCSSSDSILHVPEAIIFAKYREFIWNKRILDIGCGGGRTTTFLTHFSKKYTGIDYSGKMIALCKAQFKNARFIECDVRDMRQFDDGEFDFIFFSYNGLDLISHGGRLQGLQEIHRLLSSKGWFVFSSHNIDYRHLSCYPKLSYCLNPIDQLQRIKQLIVQTANFLKNRKYQYATTDYAIINDGDGDFALLNYYIGKTAQIRQLHHNGFEVVEIYDNKGNTLDFDQREHDSPWIYYIVQKADTEK